MKEVNVTIFGTKAPVSSSSCCYGSSCCGSSPKAACCGPAKTMQEEAEDLKESLVQNFGEAIQYAYVDVQSNEMKNYPDITKILNRVRLPLTVINGEPRFHSGISNAMISEVVGKLVKNDKNYRK